MGVNVGDALRDFVVLVVVKVDGRHGENAIGHFGKDIQEIVVNFFYFRLNLMNFLLLKKDIHFTEESIDLLEDIVDLLVDELELFLRESVGFVGGEEEFFNGHDLSTSIFDRYIIIEDVLFLDFIKVIDYLDDIGNDCFVVTLNVLLVLDRLGLSAAHFDFGSVGY